MGIRHTWVAAVAMAATACGGGSGDGLDTSGRPLDESVSVAPTANAADFATLQANVFTPICTVCHAGGSAPVGLKLDAANAYAMLVGVNSVEVPELLRVAPGDPDNSYLVQKLEGTAAVGGQMPLGGPPLDTATIQSVRQWIAAGAQAIDSSVPPATPPTVMSVTPANGTVINDVLTVVTAVFSQAMDPGLVSDLTVTLTASGGDGTFSDGNEVVITPASIDVVNTQSIRMDLADVSLADDVYEARLVGTGATSLADSGGLLLDGNNDGTPGGDFTWRFTISLVSDAPQATWRWIQDNVFTPVCTQCHIDSGIASFMLLDEANSFIATVNVPSTEVPGINRIAPGDPDNSYLVQKLIGTAAVGAQMPLGQPPLDADTIAAIRDWITAGAPLQPGDPMPATDVEPPAININAVPASVSGIIEINFSATDNVGVAAVRFYVDGLLVATSDTAPFTINWNTSDIPDGPHVLSAEAEDASGNIGISPFIEVIVDNAAGDVASPQVAILPPPNPASGTVTVSVQASDNVAVSSVELLVDGVMLGIRTLPPYQFQWDTTAYTDGLHALDARATDSSGNVGMAMTLSVTVDNTLPPDTTPPVVAIITPASPLTGVVSFEADASDDTAVAAVSFYVADVLIASVAAAPYVVNWDSTTVADGTYLLRAEALDGAGNIANSDVVSITVQNLAGPQPTWRWIQGNIFTPQCISCHRSGGIADFLWLDEASSYDQLVNSPTTEGGPPFRVQPGNPDNSSLVQRLEGTLTPQMPLGGAPLPAAEIQAVRQWILDGALAEVPPDTSAPAITLVSPGNVVSGFITITADATDDTAVATVRLFIGGQLFGSDATAPYQFLWDTNTVSDGAYELQAEADDTAGNTAVSEPILVLVDNNLPTDNEPPVVSVQPAAGALSGTVPIAIEATDNVGVTLVSLTANGGIVGTTSVAPYIVEWDTLSVANGDYELLATATDAAGNSAMSIPVNVTVANTIPLVSLSLELPPVVARGDDFSVAAIIGNTGAASPSLTATLTFSPPGSLRFEEGNPSQTIGVLQPMGESVVSWLMRADEQGTALVTVTVTDLAGDIDIALTTPVSITD
ncbi:MAG: hypothetical protein HKM98_01250 [Gammaproteobacteria bacterium]|nr:hypothetical protein [Gammaproteobacteria bacterium]